MFSNCSKYPLTQAPGCIFFSFFLSFRLFRWVINVSFHLQSMYITAKTETLNNQTVSNFSKHDFIKYFRKRLKFPFHFIIKNISNFEHFWLSLTTGWDVNISIRWAFTLRSLPFKMFTLCGVECKMVLSVTLFYST